MNPARINKPRRFSALLVAALAAMGMIAGSARALTPEQVGVVVNTASEGSKLVGKHYMTARKIPAANLLEISTDPLLRGWSEQRYREVVVAALRKQLKEKHLEDQITCLVLTYDVPLTVNEAGVSAEDKAEFAGYVKALGEYCQLLEAAPGEYDAIAGDGAKTLPAKATTQGGKLPTAAQIRAMEEKLLLAANGAMKRIEALAPDLRGRAMQRFVEVHQKFLGPAGVLEIIGAGGTGPGAAETQKKIAAMRQEVDEGRRAAAQMVGEPLTIKTRQELLALRVKLYGVVGGAQQAQEWISRIDPQDSSSCLDSELMLLWYDDYSKAHWLDNPYSLDRWPVSRGGKLPKVMMVARVDGLRPQAAIEMIDTTLRVERDGMDGVAYFDARGIKDPLYASFDRDIVDAATYVSKNSTMKVVLDRNEALLQAANCPDAALYCGWYSKRAYKDSCQWKAGAVGYHVASWEMFTLHDEKETGWVSNLLQRGFCGTLGAVEEPTLGAFPKPSQFFPLLMCGDFTQGEVYFVTCPWMSWRVGYVGDPLYNPFKVKPKLASEKVKASAELKRAYEILGALGMGPK
jgi:uncharacterized protein (TIGR03790 family)